MELDVTELLTSTDPEKRRLVWELVYQNLRALADARMRGEGQSAMTPTDLVHETFLRLIPDENARWENRRHFFSAAATAMRRILIDEARRRGSKKREGDRIGVSLDQDSGGLADTLSDRGSTENEVDVIDLHEALKRLEADARFKRKAELVNLRYFAGCPLEECAEILDVSLATTKNDWKFAKAWLARELRGEDSGGS